jgi:3-hydroxy acid dehydrogenase/malonic semialdehyde reductase
MPLSDYKTALVTGASSGIGWATATALANKGLTVHAVARREERLATLSETPGISTHALDLRDTAAIYSTLGDLEIDILVNNAGTGRGFEGLCKAAPEDIDTTLQTNLTSVYHVLRAVLPGMVQRQRGHVVNIGSSAGLYPTSSAIYGGTKSGIHMLGRNLRLEIAGSGVRVTEICPGRVTTDFFDASSDDPQFIAKMMETGIQELQPEDVADAIIYVLDTPWHVNISLLEIVPNEQAYGGTVLTPLRRS